MHIFIAISFWKNFMKYKLIKHQIYFKGLKQIVSLYRV